MNILYLAVADGRGHLMRSILIKELMESVGVGVDIITTSESGKEFVESFGHSAKVLHGSYLNNFDNQQNLDILKTKKEIMSYLVNPKRFAKNLFEILHSYGKYTMAINDTLNACMLASSFFGPKIVNIYAQNTLKATTEELKNHILLFTAFSFSLSMAHANISMQVLPINQYSNDGKNFTLNPIIQIPNPEKKGKKKKAVIYLNPLFTDKKLGKAIISSLNDFDYTIHAVGEGMANQLEGWHSKDSRLSDKIASADLIVSAPGMGVLSQVMAYKKKYVAIYSRQPEQERNIQSVRNISHIRVLDVGAGKKVWKHQMINSLNDLDKMPSANSNPIKEAMRTHVQWRNVLSILLEKASSLK